MRGRRWLAGLVLAGSAIAAGFARSRLVALEAVGHGEKELLFLPNGKHLKAMSLGQAPLVADGVYLWAIQYYSDYQRRDRYRFVEKVFGDVIAELDPHFLDPYWLGALILTVEAHDLEGGLRLLDKGFRNNPSSWILPYLAGFECYWAGRYDRAAGYFDEASRVPGAPAYMLRMKAGMFAKKGDLREAIRHWDEVLRDPRSDDASRTIAERQIRDLEIRSDVAEIEAAVSRFRTAVGRLPRGLDELAARGFLERMPIDPDGNRYAYDAATGAVSTEAGRVLGAHR